MSLDRPRNTRRTVLKRLALGTAACILGDLDSGTAEPTTRAARGRRFPRTSPEAVGIAPAAILAFVDAPVLSFFPGDAPANVSEHLAAMRVQHLMTMSTGHDKDATGPTTRAPDGNWVKGFLALPVEHPPGTHFVYNSAASYILMSFSCPEPRASPKATRWQGRREQEIGRSAVNLRSMRRAG